MGGGEENLISKRNNGSQVRNLNELNASAFLLDNPVASMVPDCELISGLLRCWLHSFNACYGNCPSPVSRIQLE
jgi:hypothetical protein